MPTKSSRKPALCAACQSEVEVERRAARTATCPSCDGPVALHERYLLERILGRGGVGVTYQACDLEDGRVVAVKELSLRRVDSLKTLELFEREAATLKRLDQPGVPHYLADFVVEQPRQVYLYLVQEFIDGEPLSFSANWSEAKVLELVVELCEILAPLHKRKPPIIHRDIKPSNLMRAVDGRLVLIDFGAVRHAIKDSQVGGSTVAGTFGYMAPEQLRGLATPASDLYAVGALAVALLAGKDAAEVLDPIRPRDWQAHVSVRHDVLVFLSRLLDPEPARRFDSALEVRDLAERLGARALEVPAAQAKSGVAPQVPKPQSVGYEGTLRALRWEWRRLRWAETFHSLSWLDVLLTMGPLFIPLSLVSTGIFFALFGTFVWQPQVIGIGVFIGGVVYGKVRVARSNAWRFGALKKGVLRTWTRLSELEGKLLESFEEEAKSLCRNADVYGAAELWGAESPMLIPVLEALAYGEAFTGEHAQAAEHLKQALDIGRAAFGEEDARTVEQLHRYPVLRVLASGFREDAIVERQRAVTLWARLEQASGLGREELLKRAMDGVVAEVESHSATRHIPRDEARRALRLANRRERLLAWLPALAGDGIWALLVTGLTSTFFGGLAMAVFLNAFYPALMPEGDPRWSLLLAPGCAFTAVFLLANVLYNRRFPKQDWRAVLFPDLDEVWRRHPKRALFIEAIEAVWRSPLAPAKECWTPFNQLLAESKTFDAAQLTHYRLLGVFLTYYLSQTIEAVGKLEAQPVRDKRVRALVLEYAAIKMLRNKGEDTAIEVMRRVLALRRV